MVAGSATDRWAQILGQYKTLDTLNQRTCCTNHWVRSFSTENGGGHAFEKSKPQKLRFNVEILSKQKKVIDGNLNSVLNYEEIINKINFFLKKKYNFLESFANDFIYEIFKNKNVLNIKIKIEKLNIIKNTESVGIEFFKTKNDYEKL
ncbi:MAG: dihydroneopterin aldolase [Proteobacteria bacterium]|nr:dihydroneopterin aldolase [Candidatus Fonsibacter sp. PEL5]